jgi:hypothetical protein
LFEPPPVERGERLDIIGTVGAELDDGTVAARVNA